MSFPAYSQFTEIQDHLIIEIERHSREFRAKPQQAAQFLDGLPEVLGRLKSAGEEEARAIGCHIPTCFGEGIERIADVASSLSRHILGSTLTKGEAVIILVQLQVHVNRLAIDIDRCGKDSFGMVMAAKHVSEGYLSLPDSEPLISWTRLISAIRNCDSCRLKIGSGSDV
jgi:hypothetical protein